MVKKNILASILMLFVFAFIGVTFFRIGQISNVKTSFDTGSASKSVQKTNNDKVNRGVTHPAETAKAAADNVMKVLPIK